MHRFEQFADLSPFLFFQSRYEDRDRKKRKIGEFYSRGSHVPLYPLKRTRINMEMKFARAEEFYVRIKEEWKVFVASFN